MIPVIVFRERIEDILVHSDIVSFFTTSLCFQVCGFVSRPFTSSDFGYQSLRGKMSIFLRIAEVPYILGISKAPHALEMKNETTGRN